MDLRPCEHEPFLTPREEAGDSLQLVDGKDGGFALGVRVEVRPVVRRAGLHEHPDDNSEESADLWHRAVSSALYDGIEKAQLACSESEAAGMEAKRRQNSRVVGVRLLKLASRPASRRFLQRTGLSSSGYRQRRKKPPLDCVCAGMNESSTEETRMEPPVIDELGTDESGIDEWGEDEADADEEGFYRWGHGKVGSYEFREVVAVEVHLEAFGGEPLFAHPELRQLLFERAIDDDGLRDCCVLPDGMRLIYDKTVDLLMVLWSLRVQTEEWAELYGAPEGQVWGDALRLRPLNTQEEVAASAAALYRLPVERELTKGDESYEFMTSPLPDAEERSR